MSDRVNLLNLTPAEAESRLAAEMTELGEPAYRSAQVLRRLWLRPVAGFDEMTEIPVALRRTLAERFDMPRLTLLTQPPRKAPRYLLEGRCVSYG